MFSKPFARRLLVIASVLVLLLAASAQYAYRQQWHRELVHYLYARMLQGELVAADTVIKSSENSPYEKWLAKNRASLPVLDTLVIQDIATVELQDWPKMGAGVKGLYLRFSDYQITDGRLLEIPVGGATLPQRHVYEVGTYIVSGSGYTLLSSEGREVEKITWQAGGLLSIPLNDTYQHFSNGGAPVRMLSVTSFPFVINSFGEKGLPWEADASFDGRRAPPGEFKDFSRDTGDLIKQLNFVDNVVSEKTAPNRSRGKSNRGAYWQLSGNTVLEMHISEFAPYSHKKAHRHSSEAFILIVSGKGYSLIWPETQSEYTRIDWRPGTLFVPPTFWYHQHFNPKTETARYLVLNTGRFVSYLGLRFYNQLEIDDDRILEIWHRELESPDQGNARHTLGESQ
jgi:uncharacterized RmlC-like cupin family protein